MSPALKKIYSQTSGDIYQIDLPWVQVSLIFFFKNRYKQKSFGPSVLSAMAEGTEDAMLPGKCQEMNYPKEMLPSSA